MILGICGPKFSGKSTLAELLIQEKKFTPMPFAEPLKQMLFNFVLSQGCDFDTARRMFWGDLKETPSEYFDNQTPRWAMQSLGGNWGRELISKTLWVNTWKRQIEHFPISNIVVEDLRHKNEAEAIKDLGGKIILISRYKETKLDDHASELEWQEIKPDLTIFNDGLPEYMLQQLESFIKI